MEKTNKKVFYCWIFLPTINATVFRKAAGAVYIVEPNVKYKHMCRSYICSYKLQQAIVVLLQTMADQKTTEMPDWSGPDCPDCKGG